MGRIGGVEPALARGQDLVHEAAVDGARREHRDATVMVLVVVPAGEQAKERPPILDRGEAAREERAVLQRLELRLREGIVVRGARPVVRLDDAQVVEAFRGRCDDPRLAVKRVPDLTDVQRSAVVKKARTWAGRDYDRRFGWDDATLYCSELAWKAYDYAIGVQIAPLGTFDDFVLLDTPVGAEFVKRRWGKNGPDREAPVVSPADTWRSDATVVVADQL
jgi:hypothetical protein